jgi:DNA-binding transcriptional regulator YdaS (Cro superfamily)
MTTQELIEKAGGTYVVADHLGVTRQAVEYWSRADRIPGDRVLAIARLAQVRPSDVRPDLYPAGLVA